MLTHSTLKILALGAAWMVMSPTLQAQDTVIVPCDGDTVFGSYCYTNNDQHTWFWQSACGAAVTVHFQSGEIEGNASDQMRIYDGADAMAPLLYSNPASDLDLAGLSFVGLSGMLYMEMTSNATNCCATGNFVGTQWGWYLTTDGATGMEKRDATDFSMFPNPADDQLHIDLPDGALGRTEVRVADALGRVVYREMLVPGLNTLDVHGLQNGSHTVLLTAPEGLVTKGLHVIH